MVYHPPLNFSALCPFSGGLSHYVVSAVDDIADIKCTSEIEESEEFREEAGTRRRRVHHLKPYNDQACWYVSHSK